MTVTADLSGAELRARLRQRGLAEMLVEQLVTRRNQPNIARQIEQIISRPAGTSRG